MFESGLFDYTQSGARSKNYKNMAKTRSFVLNPEAETEIPSNSHGRAVYFAVLLEFTWRCLPYVLGVFWLSC